MGKRQLNGFKCFLIKEGKILDVACGTGLNMLDLKKSNLMHFMADVIFPISSYMATENGVSRKFILR